MRAKEWLFENGHIEKVGRGRISLENHKRLADSGLKFSDWPKGEVTQVVVRKNDVDTNVVRVVKEDKPAATETAWLSQDDYRFPENLYQAVDATGKTYGMREACNNCGLSLCGHVCDKPSVLGLPVRIVGVK
jgi:hypothetical protein